MPQQAKSIKVPAELAGRVDRVVQQITGLSRAQVRGLIDHQSVTINGILCTEDFARVQEGDQVEVHFDPHHRYHEKARPWKDTAFRLVFEDEHLLVVEKAAWTLTVPTEANEENTLMDRVVRYLNHSKRTEHRVGIVHRLDRGTSGLLLFTKSEELARQLRDQFEARKPDRQYVAIVAGRLKDDKGTFRSYLATAPNLDRYSVPEPPKQPPAKSPSKPAARSGKTPKPQDQAPQLAITHYQVEQRLRDATFVRVTLETGRRNQIRVHFAEAGHPVLGDPRYQSRLARHPRWRYRRLALHAAVLSFIHPVTGKKLRFESSLPWEFVQFLSPRHATS